MPNMREIYFQINSIQNIRKIAKVMEMIALSKMKKTQQRMLSSRPYTETIYKVITHITSGNLEYKHPYFVDRPIRRVGYLVISSDRGLTGSLNINVFRKVLSDIKLWNKKNVDVNLVLIGAKGSSFFSFMKDKIVSQVSGMGDSPNLSELIGPIKSMLQLYDSYYIDKVYLVFNEFKSVLLQIPKGLQILPLLRLNMNYNSEKKLSENKSWDYLYEPNAKDLLNTILQRYIELQVYQGVVENLASEQASRMIAMKSAFDSAENIMKELKLIYNKVRQNKITQELIEIISGSIAVV